MKRFGGYCMDDEVYEALMMMREAFFSIHKFCPSWQALVNNLPDSVKDNIVLDQSTPDPMAGYR
jgi:hypothetical protein